MADLESVKILGMLVKNEDGSSGIVPLDFPVVRCAANNTFDKEMLVFRAWHYIKDLKTKHNYISPLPIFGEGKERFINNIHQEYQRHGHSVMAVYAVIEDLDKFLTKIDVSLTSVDRGKTIAEIITSSFTVDFPSRYYNHEDFNINNGEAFLGAIVYFIENRVKTWFDQSSIEINGNNYPFLQPEREHGNTIGDAYNIYAPLTGEKLLQTYMTPYVPENHYDRSIYGGHIHRMWMSVKAKFYIQAASICPKNDPQKNELTSYSGIFTGKLLHQVQDFYAHSNFTELLLADLCNDKSFLDNSDWSWEKIRAISDDKVGSLSNLIADNLETIPTLKEVIESGYDDVIDFTGDFIGKADREKNPHQICRIVRNIGIGAYHDYSGPTDDNELGPVGISNAQVFLIEKEGMIVVVDTISTVEKAISEDTDIRNKAFQVVKAYEVVVNENNKVYFGIKQENGVWVRKSIEEGGLPFYAWPIHYNKHRVLPMYPWKPGGYRPRSTLIEKLTQKCDFVSSNINDGSDDGLLTGYLSYISQREKNFGVRKDELIDGHNMGDESGISKNYNGYLNLISTANDLAASKLGVNLDDPIGMEKLVMSHLKKFQNSIQDVSEVTTKYHDFIETSVDNYSEWMKIGPVYKHWKYILLNNETILCHPLNHMKVGDNSSVSYQGYPEHHADLHKDFAFVPGSPFVGARRISYRNRSQRFLSYGVVAEGDNDVSSNLQSLLFWVSFKAATRDSRMTFIKLIDEKYTEINTNNWSLVKEGEQKRADYLLNLERNFHIRGDDYEPPEPDQRI